MREEFCGGKSLGKRLVLRPTER